MNYDQYRLDQTGYGPTGMGNAPTSREMRMQTMNQFRSDRMAMAMQYLIPGWTFNPKMPALVR